MSIKLSHSAINTYGDCPKSYDYRYNKKLVSKFKGSALYFGAAIDQALNHMVMNKDDGDVLNTSYKVFQGAWEQQPNNLYEMIDLPKNEFIEYSQYDFDSELLEKEDWRELYAMQADPISERNRISDILKEKEFSELTSDERMFYNLCSWLSLNRKAYYLLKAYQEQILPNIKKVIEVQKEIILEDGDKNKIVGYVDLIVEMLDGEIVVADNKTSSVEYSADSIETSTQLSLYKTILNSQYGYNIKKAAYFVVGKKLKKDKTCKVCGHKATSTHKKCNNENSEGKRCNGEWDKEIIVKTQIIVANVPDHMGDYVMENFDLAVKSITHEIFPRNFNNCINRYGSKCAYYNLCHKNDMGNLVENTKPKEK